MVALLCTMLLAPSTGSTESPKKIYRIGALNGSTPAQAAHVNLVVNLRAAQAHGLSIPQSILLRESEVIR